MVDVNQYLDDVPKDLLEANDFALANEMLKMRNEAFEGFFAKEQEHNPNVTRNLSLPPAQDYIRGVGFRTLEEVVESLESVVEAHVLEELIDAINYLFVFLIFDEGLPRNQAIAFLASLLADLEIDEWTIDEHQDTITTDSVGTMTIAMMMWTDKLRNRSWMSNTQSPEFRGWTELFKMVEDIAWIIMTIFEDREQFVKYYWAKHQVLMFRLNSKY